MRLSRSTWARAARSCVHFSTNGPSASGYPSIEPPRPPSASSRSLPLVRASLQNASQFRRFSPITPSPTQPSSSSTSSCCPPRPPGVCWDRCPGRAVPRPRGCVLTRQLLLAGYCSHSAAERPRPSCRRCRRRRPRFWVGASSFRFFRRRRRRSALRTTCPAWHAAAALWRSVVACATVQPRGGGAGDRRVLPCRAHGHLVSAPRSLALSALRCAGRQPGRGAATDLLARRTLSRRRKSYEMHARVALCLLVSYMPLAAARRDKNFRYASFTLHTGATESSASPVAAREDSSQRRASRLRAALHRRHDALRLAAWKPINNDGRIRQHRRPARPDNPTRHPTLGYHKIQRSRPLRMMLYAKKQNFRHVAYGTDCNEQWFKLR